MLASARLQTLVLTGCLDEARCFYSDVLGLPLKGQSEGALVYQVGGGDLRVSPVCPHPPNLGCSFKPSEHTVFGFAVTDLDSVVAELARRGVEIVRLEQLPHDERGVVTTPDGNRVVSIRDPDGNILSVVQFER